MGKSFDEKELFSNLFFNILKKCYFVYHGYTCFFVYHGPTCYKSVFFFQKKDKAEIIRISKITNCRPPLSSCFFYPTYVIPHVSFILVFQVPAK